MADFEKVYSIKIDTRTSMTAVKRLDKQVDRIGLSAKEAGKKFDQYIGRNSVRSVDKLNNRIAKTQLNLTKMKAGLDSVARKATMVAGAFVALGGVSLRNVIKLNEGLANVGTLLNGGVNEAARFKRGIQDMAVTTGKGTDDLTEGLYQVVSALQESSENMDQLNMSARAAVAGRSSTLGAINMLAAVTKGYGDTSAKALGHASDLAFMTVKLGQTTFPELAASIGRVVPLAAALNTRQEELFGTMATLTGVTGDTAEVSTQLASVYASMLKPTAAMKKTVDEAGYSSSAAMMKEIGFAESIKLMGKAAGGNEQKLAALFRRKEAMIAVLALLGGQSDTYTKKLAEMEKAAGATDKAYQTQTEGINKQGHEWEQTKRRMEVFSERVGDRLLPVLGQLMKRLEPIFHYLENIDAEAIESAIQFGKWAIIIAVTAKSLSGLLGVVQTLGSLQLLNGGVATLSGGMGGLATSAGIATKAVWGLQAAGLALAAIGLAKIIQDVVIDPANARTQREHGELEESTFAAEQAAKRGSLSQKEKALADLEKKHAETFGHGPRSASVEEVFQGLAHDVTFGAAGSDVGARYARQKRESEAALKKLRGQVTFERGQIQRESSAMSGDVWAVSSEAGTASGGRGVTIGPTNVTINAAGGDERKTVAILKREMDKRDRKRDNKLRRAGLAISVTE